MEAGHLCAHTLDRGAPALSSELLTSKAGRGRQLMLSVLPNSSSRMQYLPPRPHPAGP